MVKSRHTWVKYPRAFRGGEKERKEKPHRNNVIESMAAWMDNTGNRDSATL
jgi:hypothetical protein